MVAIGTAIGLVGALAGARLVRSMLYGETGIDAMTFVGVPLVLIAVAAFRDLVPGPAVQQW
jgi:hypothetical protein